VTERFDPLSRALECVRRLSDEGLLVLADALTNEHTARYDDARMKARWYTFILRGGASYHLAVLTGVQAAAAKAGEFPPAHERRVVAACDSRRTLSFFSLRPEGGVTCRRCRRSVSAGNRLPSVAT